MLQFFGTGDVFTAEYVSKLFGKPPRRKIGAALFQAAASFHGLMARMSLREFFAASRRS